MPARRRLRGRSSPPGAPPDATTGPDGGLSAAPGAAGRAAPRRPPRNAKSAVIVASSTFGNAGMRPRPASTTCRKSGYGHPRADDRRSDRRAAPATPARSPPWQVCTGSARTPPARRDLRLAAPAPAGALAARPRRPPGRLGRQLVERRKVLVQQIEDAGAADSRRCCPSWCRRRRRAPTTVSVSAGGLNRPVRAFEMRSRQAARSASLRKIRREVVSVIDLPRERRQHVGNGCVGQACSPGTSLFGTGRSSMGHTGSPVTRSNTNTKPCLVACATASIVLPSLAHRDQLRRGGRVVVPEIVVHHLEVPQPLAGARIQRQQAVAEEIRADAIGAVVVVGGRDSGKIGDAASSRRA